jgi:hypothetical protein
MQLWHVVVIYETQGGAASSWSGVVQGVDVEDAYVGGCAQAKQKRRRLGRILGGDVRLEGTPQTTWSMTHPIRAGS